ncbi:MAG: N-formylglutamate amidohydrolase [Bdellovibrionota bacterium]|nr:N-formylglutamate amidohydrolase [Bdellovibrionota bacterium]
MNKFFVSIPHSGEQVPEECHWLQTLNEVHLMRDVDRYVDRLYESVIDDLKLDLVYSPWHRYVVDLNRLPEHIEKNSVEGEKEDLSDFHNKGLHWVKTTFGETLLEKPMSRELHESLLKKYYNAFHIELEKMHEKYSSCNGYSLQLDLHSMPSKGTALHADPGKLRPEVVISDYLGKSTDQKYLDLVLSSFRENFEDVSLNDPYIGGGITRKFGKPENGNHCIQIELRRDMYMNEDTKEYLADNAKVLIGKLSKSFKKISSSL